MPRLHFDCFNGISGDMTLGALVDLGLPIATLEEGVRRLRLEEHITVRAERVKRAGIMGTKVHVETTEHHAHRHLRHVVAILDAADLPAEVRDRARAAFVKIAEAEALVHGSTPEKIHFHEVGMMDAIADVALSMLGLHELGATDVTASEVVVGSGTVECAHGVMPVPAPATVEILRGIPTRSGPIAKEMTTPTGAAILATVARSFGEEAPPLRPGKIGYGAGTRVFERHPNMLRVVMEAEAGAPDGGAGGGPSRATSEEREGGTALALRAALAGLGLEVRTLAVLACDLDDVPGTWLPPLRERLVAAGAREVHWVANVMKKGRSGVTLEVLADPDRAGAIAEVLLHHAPTLGVRAHVVERVELGRRAVEVALPDGLGSVRAKVATWGGAVLRATPEFDDCAAIAARAGLPLADVLRLAERAARDAAGLP